MIYYVITCTAIHVNLIRAEPNSSEGNEGTTTKVFGEDAHCQSIDLKINDAYDTKGDLPSVTMATFTTYTTQAVSIDLMPTENYFNLCIAT